MVIKMGRTFFSQVQLCFALGGQDNIAWGLLMKLTMLPFLASLEQQGLQGTGKGVFLGLMSLSCV